MRTDKEISANIRQTLSAMRSTVSFIEAIAHRGDKEAILWHCRQALMYSKELDRLKEELMVYQQEQDFITEIINLAA